MSMDYIITLNVLPKRGSTLRQLDLIKLLLENNWELHSENKEIIFTDIGDTDDYNFIKRSISIDDYFKIIEVKEKNNETIAFAAYFDTMECKYRMDVSITPDYSVTLSPDDSTKKLLNKGYKLLDVSWYLEKIIPCFETDRISIENFTFSQFY